jgi:8-oxo-dGTP pyrophosphatase MutT (NUDIX family)
MILMAHTIQSNAAGGVVVGKNGKVAVVNQNNDSWSLPKGHIDPGEDTKAAAIREIAEEAGLTDIKFIKNLGKYQRYRLSKDGGDDTSDLKTIHMFLFTTDQEELKPQDPSNPEARWVDADKVSRLLTHRKDKHFFEQIKPQLLQFLKNN